MTTIAAMQWLPSSPPPTTAASNTDGDLFASLVNGTAQAPSGSGNPGAGTTMAPSTQAALVQMQAVGSAGQAGPPTALSGLGGTIDPNSERQFVQTFGADFAQSMDTNGDGTVTESELVNKLHSDGGLDPVLGQQLYDKLSPNDAPLTVAQLTASATTLFMPSWANASS